jgi:uncharacterized protein (UPF0548 family)
MWYLRKPSPRAKAALLQANDDCAFTYASAADPGMTRHWQVGRPETVRGFNVDHNCCEIGRGLADFEIARQGLFAWKMAPPWVAMAGRIEPAELVSLEFQLAGLYWLSCGRVVYTFDEAEEAGATLRCGFAYGTLPGHVETGEERFSVALRPDGSVVYELMAFSRPRYWAARLVKPLARHWQRQFVKDSQAALRSYVASMRG